jgi:hypothetical protein
MGCEGRTRLWPCRSLETLRLFRLIWGVRAMYGPSLGIEKPDIGDFPYAFSPIRVNPD